MLVYPVSITDGYEESGSYLFATPEKAIQFANLHNEAQRVNSYEYHDNWASLSDPPRSERVIQDDDPIYTHCATRLEPTADWDSRLEIEPANVYRIAYALSPEEAQPKREEFDYGAVAYTVYGFSKDEVWEKLRALMAADGVVLEDE